METKFEKQTWFQNSPAYLQPLKIYYAENKDFKEVEIEIDDDSLLANF